MSYGSAGYVQPSYDIFGCRIPNITYAYYCKYGFPLNDGCFWTCNLELILFSVMIIVVLFYAYKKLRNAKKEVKA